MNASGIDPPPGVPELVFPLVPSADIYAIHQALDAKLGARHESRYLWSLQRGASADFCIVRLPDNFMPPTIAAGDHWLFGLRARVIQKDFETGRRRSYRRSENARRLNWLERRGPEHGFSVVAATVTVAREPVRRPKSPFWLDLSDFSGIIEIVDAEKIAAALRKGIGGGRTWGLGMLRLIEKKED